MAALALAVVEVPAVTALGAAALGAVAEIHMVGCATADGATVMLGAWPGVPHPPSFVNWKYGDALLQAEAAPAVVMLPADLLADMLGATRTGKHHVMHGEGPVTQAASRVGAQEHR